MAKRQSSLVAFGFTKTVKHRGKVTEVNIPTMVIEDYEKLFKCSSCPKRFLEKRVLVVHMKYLHPPTTTSKCHQIVPKKTETVETVKIVLSEIVTSVDKEVRIPTIEDVEEEQARTRTGRRGNDRREKHTTIKQSNVIDDFEASATQDELAVENFFPLNGNGPAYAASDPITRHRTRSHSLSSPVFGMRWRVANKYGCSRSRN